MTNDEFKARKKPGLIEAYKREPDKVMATDAFQLLNQSQRGALQRAFEANDGDKVMRYLQRARTVIADTLAEARLDEIIADGKIDIATEADEISI